jgi:group I intron endonuclease
MEKKYIVYMHENKTNHKKYIGITSQDPETRWRKGTNYRNCHAIRRAFEKYGWDGFEHIILYEGLTKEEACEKEIQLISEYDTRNPEHGYNICIGGGGTSGFAHTEEWKEELREKMSGSNNPNYGKPMSEEQKEKLRQINLGKKLTEEHKRKISDGCKGKIHHDEDFKKRLAERNKHSVIRDDGMYFDTVDEAAAYVGVTPSAISNAMRRGNRSGGYYWKLAELKA